MENEQNIVYFATGNNNKFKEVSEIFQNQNLKFSLKQSTIELIEVQANTCKEVALYKLNSIIDKIDDSVFVEDAGFFVDEPLNGFPGVYSSYVYKTIGNEGILNLISDFNKTKAHFTAVISFYFKPLDKIFTFEGIVNGSIATTIRGKGGFGFDPIFIPESNPEITFAELSTIEKNKLSHRGKALNSLVNFLKKCES